MHNQFQWTILDVEEEEWDAVVEAAAPVKPATEDDCRAASRGAWCRPQALVGIASFAILMAIAAYAVGQHAERGLVHMENDIAVVVKAEALQQRELVVGHDEHATVESTEFLDGKAMAQVVVTRTLPSGEKVASREVRFYAQSHQGWSRTKAIAAFWGEPATFDTQHLHFVFGARDRGVVAKVAPDAEAYYVALRQSVGSPLGQGALPSSTLLTIELVPRIVVMCERPEPSWLRLTSPLLYEPALNQDPSEIFAYDLREALVHQVLDIQPTFSQPKSSWDFMTLALRAWLLSSAKLPLTSDFDHSKLAMAAATQGVHLDDLLSVPECSTDECAHLRTQTTPLVSQPHSYDFERLSTWQDAACLLDYIATEYGLNALGSLVQGFTRFDDWETLAAAALGISAQQLEAGWREYRASNEAATQPEITPQ